MDSSIHGRSFNPGFVGTTLDDDIKMPNTTEDDYGLKWLLSLYHHIPFFSISFVLERERASLRMPECRKAANELFRLQE